MINVTERAKQELKRLLFQKVDLGVARLRLMDRGRGILGLGIDIEKPGDHTVEYEGAKVLVIEPEFAANLKGLTIDVEDTPEGAVLVISEEP